MGGSEGVKDLGSSTPASAHKQGKPQNHHPSMPGQLSQLTCLVPEKSISPSKDPSSLNLSHLGKFYMT